jgi:hypothetical protein
VGSGESPAVRFEVESGGAPAFVVAEIIEKIRPVLRIWGAEPKNEFIFIRQRSRFGREFPHNVNT